MAGYSGDRVPAMQRRMIDAMEAIPGVDVGGIWSVSPPLHMGWDTRRRLYRPDDGFEAVECRCRTQSSSHISPEYFHAAGTALLIGQGFHLA